ncbi:MAG: hypothetical protein VB140_09960 [Burkholderia sp.]
MQQRPYHLKLYPSMPLHLHARFMQQRCLKLCPLMPLRPHA